MCSGVLLHAPVIAAAAAGGGAGGGDVVGGGAKGCVAGAGKGCEVAGALPSIRVKAHSASNISRTESTQAASRAASPAWFKCW